MSGKTLLEHIKDWLAGSEELHRTNITLSKVSSLESLKFTLDEATVINEIHVEQIQKRLSKLGDEQEALEKLVVDSEMSPQDKILNLRKVKTLRKKVQSLTNILLIRQDNAEVHLTLLHKITEIESMGKKALIEPTIDEIQVEYDTQITGHLQFMDSVKTLEEQMESRGEEEDLELLELELELLKKHDPEKAAKFEKESTPKIKETSVSNKEEQLLMRSVPLPKPVVPSRPPLAELLKEESKKRKEEVLKKEPPEERLLEHA